MKTIHIVSLNLSHIPEDHWNKRLEKASLDLRVKYGYPYNTNEPVILIDACMFLTEDFYQAQNPWAAERASMIDLSHRNTHGWLMEPYVIHPNHYEDIHKVKNKFGKIFTHKKELITEGSQFVFCPNGDCWIDSHGDLTKDSLVSIIASAKNTTEGHQLRHEAVKQFRTSMDLFGKGYHSIAIKNTALEPFMFSVVIENCREDCYFTEKIIDCFRTKTVPIYWGCPTISDYFNNDGILTFSNINELGEILETLSEDKYKDMAKAIEDNYYRSLDYDTYFHSLYLSGLKTASLDLP